MTAIDRVGTRSGLSLVPRVTAAVTGVLLGAGIGLLVIDGRVWPLLALPLLALALWVVMRALVPPEDRASVGAAMALGFALHVAVAVGLYAGSLAAGRGGFIPGDDAAYARLAAAFVDYLKGRPDALLIPPGWGGHAYLFGTWVYLESAIFFLIGPDVLVPILLNGAFGLATALLAFDIARRLFDRRAAFLALLLVAFYPSLVLWSSLNLKDALALLLIGLCVWSLVRFQAAPGWWPLVLAFAVLVPMESLRRYLFVGLDLFIPLVVALTPRLALATRLRWTMPAFGASATFLLATQLGVGLGPQLLDTFEASRQNMGVGARTRFVEAPPVRVKEGDTFAVGPSSCTDVVYVAPNARIVVVTDPPVPTSAPEGVVYVQPGMCVVVGSAGTSPAPVERRGSIQPDASTTMQFQSEDVPTDVTAVRTLGYLPIGLAFALFAPFPWQISRLADLLVMPEMVLWYAALFAAGTTLVRHRERWQVLFVLGGLAAGLLLLLALVEGNVGTLYRHRAMSVPWVLLLAAPSLADLGLRVRRWWSERPRPTRTTATDAG